MLGQVERVVDVVTRHHPNLRVAAAALLTAAQAYLVATQRLLERIVDEGAATRDFSLLDPSDYARLATMGTVEELAVAFEGVVWDPPRPQVAPADIIAALRAYRPHRRQPRRPPVEADASGPSVDPLEGLDERLDILRRQREHAAELLLQGAHFIELSAHLRASPWPAALRSIVELATLDADEYSAYRLTMADTIVIDTDAHTTWTSDARLSVERRPIRSEAAEENRSSEGAP
jgi:hypothetical protein